MFLFWVTSWESWLNVSVLGQVLKVVAKPLYVCIDRHIKVSKDSA